MAEKLLELASLFENGLRAMPEQKRSPLMAQVFDNMRPEKGGAVPHSVICNLLSAAQMTSASLDLDDMPFFPQLLQNRGSYCIGSDGSLRRLPAVVGQAASTAITTYDPADMATPNSIVTGGGQWDYLYFGDFELFCNENNLVIRHPYLHATRHAALLSSAYKIPASVIFHQGRFIACGFAGVTNYWGTSMQALWDRMIVEGQNWGYTPSDAGPASNWLFYSSFGVFDILYHMFPTLAVRGNSAVSFTSADEIYMHEQFSIPGFQRNPLATTVALSPPPLTTDPPVTDIATGITSAVGWSYNNKARYIKYDTASIASTVVLHVSRTDMNQPFTATRKYRIKFGYRITHASSIVTPVMRLALGGTTILDINGTAGVAYGDIVDVDMVVTCGSTPTATYGITLTFAPLVVFATNTQEFLMYGLSIKEELQYAHGYVGQSDDEVEPFLLELIRRNEAGFIPMPFAGKALRTKGTRKHVLVFGEDGIAAATPGADRGLALSFMGLTDELSEVGVLGRSAMAGDQRGYYFIDKSGTLWSVDDELQTQKLGYQDYLKNLSSVVMSWDHEEKAALICGVEYGDVDAPVSYLLKGGRLSQIRQRASSQSRIRGTLYGFSEELTNSNTFVVESQKTDFGYRGHKELNCVEVGSRNCEDMTISSKYNPENGSQVIEVGPVYGSPDGTFFPQVSGNDIAVRLTGEAMRQILTNGSFTGTASVEWTFGGNWTHASSVKASHSSPHTADLVHKTTAMTETLIAGTSYLVEFDVLDYSSGGVRISLGGQTGLTRTANGRYQEIVVAGTDGIVLVDANPSDATDFVGSIDNLSVRLYDSLIERMDVRFDYADNRSAFSARQKEQRG